ncbi:RNA dependent RNA polymerase-domain-containing protein [Kalaharituber pfeilii]|nr:RNA dependent RNA polymerase-domain-containing protein [Kalaharituber pfeilii]
MSSLRNFEVTLQHTILPSDTSWSYTVPNLPTPAVTDSIPLVKLVSVISNKTKQVITLRYDRTPGNRILAMDPAHRFILISFADFRLRYPAGSAESQREGLRRAEQAAQRRGDAGKAPQRPLPPGQPEIPSQETPPKESADYIVRILQCGIEINGQRYHFYGHSNSQLKSKTCFLFNATPAEISQKIESLGDFSKLKSVAKKAKRIGLLFSNARVAIQLDPEKTEDIGDVETKDYCFTDGCGLIAPGLARELAKKSGIVYRNKRYTPSVLQIRYRGYKGVLMQDSRMDHGDRSKLVKFRKSMKKFAGGPDYSFAVVGHSKPYSFGRLNDEIVLLISSLGITNDTLLRKQKEHLEFLDSATVDAKIGFQFLSYCNRPELAERLLMEGLDAVKADIRKLVSAERSAMINKRDDQRCRIMIPQSRLLFGVADYLGVLREGECAVTVTLDGDGRARSLAGAEILVSRNPCLHPGDVRKFKSVYRQELAHLVDCIVFPTKGKRPSADLMSGGDLDGDQFLVCWDKDVIPSVMSEPAAYTGAKEPLQFGKITDNDRLEYFARYTNTSLGRVKNLFLDWARTNSTLSPECQQLNYLFSNCVDGHKINIPQHLQSPPARDETTPPFVLDVLHEDAKLHIATRIATSSQEHGGAEYEYEFDLLQLLLIRDKVALSEFELIQMAYRWCRARNVEFSTFIHYFDYNALRAHEKAWVLEQLPRTMSEPALVMNALLQSSLISPQELKRVHLDYPAMRWKRIFSSEEDRMGNLLNVLEHQVMNTFHKKFIVLQIEARLTVAMYIPHLVEAHEEFVVSDSIRLFAFTPTQAEGAGWHRVIVRTKKNYRLFYDGNVLELFDLKRANTFIHLRRGVTDAYALSGIEGKGNRRRALNEIRENRDEHPSRSEERNWEWRASIALDKFSKRVQTQVGRVNRDGIKAVEVYVISNRDIQGQQILDLWLEQIDTDKVIPRFERLAREYSLPTVQEADWTTEPEFLEKVVRYSDFDVFHESTFKAEMFTEMADWLLIREERGMLLKIYRYILNSCLWTEEQRAQVDRRSGSIPDRIPDLLPHMIDFLTKAPFLAVTFIRLYEAEQLLLNPTSMQNLQSFTPKLLTALILSANEIKEFALPPFEQLTNRIRELPLATFADLVEKVALAVSHPDIVLDLLLGVLERESSRVLKGPSKIVEHFKRNLIGIALEHMDEAAETSRGEGRKNSLLITLTQLEEVNMVHSKLRIDAPRPARLGDHVRLLRASPPVNMPLAPMYVMDAVVEKAFTGSVTLRCIHPPPPWLERCDWRIVNCGGWVTAKTMLDAVRTFSIDREDACRVIDELLGLEGDDRCLEEINESEEVKYVPTPKLNRSQNEAVRATLSHPLTCLWGPPGTGKTSTIVVILMEHLKRMGAEEKILVAAPTHNAVDNVMEKFLKSLTELDMEADSSPLKGIKDRVLRMATDAHKVAPHLVKYTCDAMVGKDLNIHAAARKKALARVRVGRLFFTTCAGAGLGLLRDERFDMVVIDEASQQTEPTSLIPLVKGCKRAVLVGDHVQLRATVGKHASGVGFEVSLFERLYSMPTRKNTAKVMLDTQYRMHRGVCNFSSREFYEGKLMTGVPDEARTLPQMLFEWPQLVPGSTERARMVFMKCSEPEDMGQKSKSNSAQAVMCREIVRRLMEVPIQDQKKIEFTSADGAEPSMKETTSSPESSKPFSIAILTPYSRQADLLRQQISTTPPKDSLVREIKIETIDAFQGREADIVLFCTVRCNVHGELGFLKDMRRLNVALTRAKIGVIIVGDRSTLTSTGSGKLLDRDVDGGVDKAGEADGAQTPGEMIVESHVGVWKRLMEELVEVEFPDWELPKEEEVPIGKGKRVVRGALVPVNVVGDSAAVTVERGQKPAGRWGRGKPR